MAQAQLNQVPVHKIPNQGIMSKIRVLFSSALGFNHQTPLSNQINDLGVEREKLITKDNQIIGTTTDSQLQNFEAASEKTQMVSEYSGSNRGSNKGKKKKKKKRRHDAGGTEGNSNNKFEERVNNEQV